MAIHVIRTGLLLSVQDMGRKGFRRFGVPVGGCMDKQAARVANVLCGNPPEAAVLEIVLHGAKLCTDKDQLVCFAGAGAAVYVNNVCVPTYRPVWLTAGSEIDFRIHPEGCHMYMAVAGGFETPLVMGSRSQAAVLGMDRLKSGTCLPVGLPGEVSDTLARRIVREPGGVAPFGVQAPPQQEIVRFLRGPEWGWFTKEATEHWRAHSFRISAASNRMGFRLSGTPLFTEHPVHMLSTSVMPGTVQVTPDGTPLLLMADAQTTGGYPRIAQVIEADLAVCAQLRPGADLRFREVGMEEALEALLVQNRFIHDLEVSVRINLCG